MSYTMKNETGTCLLMPAFVFHYLSSIAEKPSTPSKADILRNAVVLALATRELGIPSAGPNTKSCMVRLPEWMTLELGMMRPKKTAKGETVGPGKVPELMRLAIDGLLHPSVYARREVKLAWAEKMTLESSRTYARLTERGASREAADQFLARLGGIVAVFEAVNPDWSVLPND